MTTLCRYIRHGERARYEAEGRAVAPCVGHHAHYGLLATKVIDDDA